MFIEWTKINATDSSAALLWSFEPSNGWGITHREFYDLRADPYQVRNDIAGLTNAEVHAYHAELDALFRCKGAQCWKSRGAGIEVGR